jgi:uncharacterized SAM-binding protein YcdF (DUF218 family)
VIFLLGAAVLPSGGPSPALARRIAAAACAATERPDAVVFCSGGVGRHGPAEAVVMAGELIRSGLSPSRLRLDGESRDTFQSVLALAAFLRAEPGRSCIVCTDDFHRPRVRLMLAVLGFASEPGPDCVPQGAPWRYRLRMAAREALAIPYDLALVLWRRVRGAFRT